jgi:predicted RNase H-like HicB family nuclease
MAVLTDEPRNAAVDRTGRSLELLVKGYTIAEVESSSSDVERLVVTKNVPTQLVDRYVREAVKRVRPSEMEDGSGWFVEIPDLDGVWASAELLDAALAELRDVLVDWLLLKIQHEDRDIPVLAGIDLNYIA